MECCICSNTSELTDTTTLPCGHSFHSHCLCKWLWEKTSCPICRDTPVSSDSDDDESDYEIIGESVTPPQKKTLPYSIAVRRSAVKRNKSMARKIECIKTLRSKAQNLRKSLKIVNNSISAVQRAATIKRNNAILRHRVHLKYIKSDMNKDTRYFRQSRGNTMKKISDIERYIKRHKEDVVRYANEVCR